MQSSHGSSNRALVAVSILLCLAAAFVLSGCDLASTGPTDEPGVPSDTPAPSQPTAVPTPEVEGTPVPSTITLTVWTTEAFSPTETITSGQILAQQIADLQSVNSDIGLEFVLKQEYGKGGVLDFLLTTQSVVPHQLPDVAVLDIDELETALEAGLVQPLDELVPAELVNDLYPAAKASSTFDGKLYGLQYRADLEHLVYNTGKMAVPPRSWPGVLSNPGPYVFAAGGRAGLVNDAFIIQYLAEQPGSPEADAGELVLDQDSIAAVLQYYQDGLSRGIVPADVLNYHTSDGGWLDYLAGDAAFSHVSAQRYLADREDLQSSAPAPIPAISGPAAGLNRGWALVLITEDPQRQSAAAELMLRLLSPEVNAAWNLAAGYLPTRHGALALWDQEDNYTPFADQQLQAARPRPRHDNYTQIAAALQEAVESVLLGEATPAEAAEEVMKAAQ